ncbi:MAG: hypothetical protein NWF06_04150 [Candidatus Bathyarchaeota archaeon]|nr:hypothetical protein [Candidatus Bathyarchaeum sp.]
MTNLPKLGDKLPVDKIHVSPCNVRYGEPRGDSEEDKILEESLKHNRIRNPVQARPEGDGYGVYVGAGRLILRSKYTKHLIVGEEIVIKDVTEEEARLASFTENNPYLKRTMHPITYAEQLNKLVAPMRGTIRIKAERIGLSPATLSQYMTILEGLTSQQLRTALKKHDIPYKGKSHNDPHSILGLAKLKLTKDKQEELAQTLTTEGTETFWTQIDTLSTGKQKRGLQKGTFDVDRITWNKRNEFDAKRSSTIDQAAKNKGMTRAEYTKQKLLDHWNEIEKDAQTKQTT